MKTKYIIFETKNGIELPIVFPETLMHVFVSDAMIRYKDHDGRSVLGFPISAGFCRISTNNKYVCSGHSESLNLKSRPEDSEILTRLLS